jgi:hypothetical protein
VYVEVEWILLAEYGVQWYVQYLINFFNFIEGGIFLK